jgi:hypothetical protein
VGEKEKKKNGKVGNERDRDNFEGVLITLFAPRGGMLF